MRERVRGSDSFFMSFKTIEWVKKAMMGLFHKHVSFFIKGLTIKLETF